MMTWRRGALTCIAVAVVPLLVAVGSACGGGTSTPGTSIPSADATNDAPDGGDANTSEASAQCVPDPIVVDGGPESAACGPNGAEVNLSTSGEHCGFCGNSCGAGTCSAGTCVGTRIVATDERVEFARQTDGKTLYVSTNDVDCASTRIWRLGLGPPVTFNEVVAPSGNGCVYWLAAVNGRLLYQSSAIGIVSLSLANPADKSTLVSNAGISHAVVAGDTLFWSSYGVVESMSSSGGTSQIVHDEGSTSVRLLDGDDDGAWWVTRAKDGGPTPATEGDLWARAAGASSSLKIAPGLGSVDAMALDDSFVYVAMESGDVKRVPKNGGTAELVTHIDSGGRTPRGLFLQGDWVYVAIADGANPRNDPFDLHRAKKCGGAPKKVARDYWLGDTAAMPPGKFFFGGVGQVRVLDITTP